TNFDTAMFLIFLAAPVLALRSKHMHQRISLYVRLQGAPKLALAKSQDQTRTGVPLCGWKM
ncbi:MAG TPA: hypothetical protein VMG63_08940, partial [Terriglobia bacterium]|nr:hypothetical protein [Terriglobia bacterium]